MGAMGLYGAVRRFYMFLFILTCLSPPIPVWVTVWGKQNGPLKSGPKSSKVKEKPPFSIENGGVLVAGAGFEPTTFGL